MCLAQDAAVGPPFRHTEQRGQRRLLRHQAMNGQLGGGGVLFLLAARLGLGCDGQMPGDALRLIGSGQRASEGCVAEGPDYREAQAESKSKSQGDIGAALCSCGWGGARAEGGADSDDEPGVVGHGCDAARRLASTECVRWAPTTSIT
jgi:hypothetical protein